LAIGWPRSLLDLDGHFGAAIANSSPMRETKMDLARRDASARAGQVSIEHYLRLILHRKWVVAEVLVVVSAVTAAVVARLPEIYTAETLILVDPQKVPESYVKSTVTGDVRNRLSTLSQQILSATRLQKIIDTFNLYPEERKAEPREDVINKMRSDIKTLVASDFGGSQDLQAFRISYRGHDARLVSQVTNQLASLFIEENLKAREEQATGTTEFLSNQLQEARRTLEAQEAQLKDFKLKHLGEMPEQQTANLQILGQLQSELQVVNESLSRAEQQRNVTVSMISQTAPVVELDDNSAAVKSAPVAGRAPLTPLQADQARLQALYTRGYANKHPDIRNLKARIEQEQTSAGSTTSPAIESDAAEPVRVAETPAPSERAPARKAPQTVPHQNPVLQAQITALDAEIAKQKSQQERLSKAIADYRGKVEAIPVREQQIAELQRDYEMSKAHYTQLLDKQLSAETATQLEIRQKGEKFKVLDPAVPPERPSSPNRPLIDSMGVLGGLCLGLLSALSSELRGMRITDTAEISSTAVLEVIPIIRTQHDRIIARRRLVAAAVSVAFVVATALIVYFLHAQGLRT
jgi:succinoglycan biosynthesis transport protein ExoP